MINEEPYHDYLYSDNQDAPLGHLYRVVDRYTNKDSLPDIIVQGYRIDKITPKGAWIESGTKFVLNTAHKRFAYPTIEEAWTSFRKRKERQLAILQGQIEHVELVLEHMQDRGTERAQGTRKSYEQRYPTIHKLRMGG